MPIPWSAPIYAQMAVMNDNLYVFRGARANNLFMYNGTNWVNFNSTFSIPGNYIPSVMKPYRGKLVVGAQTDPNQQSGTLIAWDSTSNTWGSLGGGVDGGNHRVSTMDVFNGDLFIGGKFDSVGTGTNKINAQNIAKWNGTRWDSVSLPSAAREVHSMIVWNGKITILTSNATNGWNDLFQYDGVSWNQLATPMGTIFTGFTRLDTINGELLIWGRIGIIRDGANSRTFVNSIGTYDGSRWRNLGDQRDNARVSDLQSYNNKLYVTFWDNVDCSSTGPMGFDYPLGGVVGWGVHEWDGSNWCSLEPGSFEGVFQKMVTYDDKLLFLGTLDSSCSGSFVSDLLYLCDENTCGEITGNVYQDVDNDCMLDTTDYPLREKWVQVSPGPVNITTDENGYYAVQLPEGNYTVDIPQTPMYYQRTCQPGPISVRVDSGLVTAGVDFPLDPITKTNDLRINVHTAFLRPGFPSRIHINYENVGTEPLSPTIEYVLDSLLTYDSLTTIPLDTVKGDTLIWQVATLLPTEKARLSFNVKVSLNAQINDTVWLAGTIFPVQGDTTPQNNFDLTQEFVTGSFDPNDKQVFPTGNGPEGNIPPETETLTYKIRFQNTGNDTAFFVIIRDELDDDLDLTTLHTIASSHPYTFHIEEGQKVNWRFDNILLPDSNTNEPESHGFVTFTIDLVDNLPLGTEINNTAAIYFDYNLPIITNTTRSTLFRELVSIDMSTAEGSLTIWPQPAEEWINLSMAHPLQQATVLLHDLQGRQVARYSDLSGEQIKVPTRDLLPGIYLIKIEDTNGQQATSKVVIQ
ncbi:MAG: T9SS type A sorting domain-containing protein [Bacteroidota bacterium]